MWQLAIEYTKNIRSQRLRKITKGDIGVGDLHSHPTLANLTVTGSVEGDKE